MSALMAERRESGRQESLFEGLAPPRPNPWARPPDAPPPPVEAEPRDADAERAERYAVEAPAAEPGAGPGAPSPELPATAPASDGAPAGPALVPATVGERRAARPEARAAAPSAPEGYAGPTVEDEEAYFARRDEAVVPAAHAVATPHVHADHMHAAGAPLDGPTLDDVISRDWEGLAIGLPAACPLCHGEIVPALGGPLSGTCASCGTTID